MIHWLEVIKLRSAGRSSRVLQELSLSMARINQGGPVEMKIYRHAALETDLTVVLHWKTGRTEPNGSALGLRLAQSLRDFGLIDHSVWVEEKEQVFSRKSE